MGGTIAPWYKQAQNSRTKRKLKWRFGGLFGLFMTSKRRLERSARHGEQRHSRSSSRAPRVARERLRRRIRAVFSRKTYAQPSSSVYSSPQTHNSPSSSHSWTRTPPRLYGELASSAFVSPSSAIGQYTFEPQQRLPHKHTKHKREAPESLPAMASRNRPSRKSHKVFNNSNLVTSSKSSIAVSRLSPISEVDSNIGSIQSSDDLNGLLTDDPDFMEREFFMVPEPKIPDDQSETLDHSNSTLEPQDVAATTPSSTSKTMKSKIPAVSGSRSTLKYAKISKDTPKNISRRPTAVLSTSSTLEHTETVESPLGHKQFSQDREELHPSDPLDASPSRVPITNHSSDLAGNLNALQTLSILEKQAQALSDLVTADTLRTEIPQGSTISGPSHIANVENPYSQPGPNLSATMENPYGRSDPEPSHNVESPYSQFEFELDANVEYSYSLSDRESTSQGNDSLDIPRHQRIFEPESPAPSHLSDIPLNQSQQSPDPDQISSTDFSDSARFSTYARTYSSDRRSNFGVTYDPLVSGSHDESPLSGYPHRPAAASHESQHHNTAVETNIPESLRLGYSAFQNSSELHEDDEDAVARAIRASLLDQGSAISKSDISQKRDVITPKTATQLPRPVFVPTSSTTSQGRDIARDAPTERSPPGLTRTTPIGVQTSTKVASGSKSKLPRQTRTSTLRANLHSPAHAKPSSNVKTLDSGKARRITPPQIGHESNNRASLKVSKTRAPHNTTEHRPTATDNAQTSPPRAKAKGPSNTAEPRHSSTHNAPSSSPQAKAQGPSKIAEPRHSSTSNTQPSSSHTRAHGSSTIIEPRHSSIYNNRSSSPPAKAHGPSKITEPRHSSVDNSQPSASRTKAHSAGKPTHTRAPRASHRSSDQGSLRVPKTRVPVKTTESFQAQNQGAIPEQPERKGSSTLDEGIVFDHSSHSGVTELRERSMSEKWRHRSLEKAAKKEQAGRSLPTSANDDAVLAGSITPTVDEIPVSHPAVRLGYPANLVLYNSWAQDAAREAAQQSQTPSKDVGESSDPGAVATFPTPDHGDNFPVRHSSLINQSARLMQRSGVADEKVGVGAKPALVSSKTPKKLAESVAAIFKRNKNEGGNASSTRSQTTAPTPLRQSHGLADFSSVRPASPGSQTAWGLDEEAYVDEQLVTASPLYQSLVDQAPPGSLDASAWSEMIQLVNTSRVATIQAELEAKKASQAQRELELKVLQVASEVCKLANGRGA